MVELIEITPTEIIRYYDQLRNNRYMWETLWQDVIDYMLPYRRSVYEDTNIQGEDRSVEIYDSTATLANIRLAAGLNSTLTNPNMMWFGLETNDLELNKEVIVKEFLQTRTRKIKKAYDGSNFYVEVHEMYLDIGSLGTGVLYVEPSDKGKLLNFKSCHIREIFIDEDPNGVVDTVMRKFSMSVKQCMQKWGKKCSDSIKELFASGEFNKDIEILHAVFPRMKRDKKMNDRLNMRYASVWIEFDNQHMIDEGGYRTMPYIIPRWLKSSGEMYGRSPAISILADIKTLNEMMYSLLLAGQMQVEPPLQVPDEGFLNINVEPRGISYYRAGTNDRILPLDLGKNVPLTYEMVKIYQEKIADAFLQNKLELIDKREMTAEEVRARMSENARVLGPTMGRLEFEFLTTLNERVSDILENDVIDSKGRPYLEEVPAMLVDEDIMLKFTSPVARNQRMQEAEAVGYFLQGLRNNSQLDPTVLDNVNWDAVTELDAEVFGIPGEILNDARTVQAIRKNRAAQQEQAQQIQMQMLQLQAGKTQAETQKDSALAQKHASVAQKNTGGV